jgi:hypothetical protein
MKTKLGLQKKLDAGVMAAITTGPAFGEGLCS